MKQRVEEDFNEYCKLNKFTYVVQNPVSILLGDDIDPNKSFSNDGAYNLYQQSITWRDDYEIPKPDSFNYHGHVALCSFRNEIIDFDNYDEEDLNPLALLLWCGEPPIQTIDEHYIRRWAGLAVMILPKTSQHLYAGAKDLGIPFAEF